MDPLTLKAASLGAGDRLETGVEVAKKVGPSRFDELSQKVAGDPAMQAKIYQISEDVELLSKMVDQATSGVKTVLQTQVG